MNPPVRIAIILAVLGSAIAATAAVAAIPIYTNQMSSAGARSQIERTGDGSCDRGAAGRALMVTVGKRTRECQLRTPVVGSNLDIAATARLLSDTPADIRRRVFVAVGVRTGNDGGYLLAVFPARGTYQLRRDVPDGDSRLLANGKSRRVKNVGKANRLRVRAFPSGDGTQVTAFVNGRKVASAVEDAHTSATVSGRFSSLVVGSTRAANGAQASFDKLRVSVPDPF